MSWRVESLEPWAASGPGWSNKGVTADLVGEGYIDSDGVIRLNKRRITLYEKDLSSEEHLAMEVGILAHRVLQNRMLQEIAKEDDHGTAGRDGQGSAVLPR